MSERRSLGILVVDDDDGVRAVIARALVKAGYPQPALADSVPSARAALDEHGPFDVVLLDIRLPGGLGLDLLGRFALEVPGMRIIMITGVDDISVAVRAVKMGACDYLVKPLKLSEVLSAVERAWHSGPDLPAFRRATSTGQ